MGEECFQYTIVEDLALPEELQSFVCKQCNEFFLSEEEFQNHTANQCFRFESNQQQKNETITNTSGENGCSPLTDLYKNVEPLPGLKCFKDNNQNILNEETSNFQDRELSFVESNLSSEVGPFRCIMCEQIFQSRLQYSSHMSSHTGEKAHQCEICLVKFDFKSALTMHLKRKHNICKSEFKCNLCEKTFYSSAESNKHIKSHSSTGSNFTVCGQTSGKKKDIVTHMLTHVTTDQTPDHAQSHNEMQRLPYLLELKNVFQTCGLFQCFQCKLLFPALSVLEKHTLNEHGIDTSEIHANLVLNVETFSERNDSAAVAADINEELESNNANPVVTASGSKESVAIAIDVNQSSEFQINNTNLAVTSSETVKPSENFYRSSALLFQNTNPIIFTLTPSNGTVEYQTQSLINIPILLTMQPTDHVVTNGENVSMSPPLNEWKPSAEDLHSDAEMAEDTERTCPICKKTISSRSNLRVHMMIHTREQPHTCPYPGCGKKFTQRSPLQRHMAIHSGEKPWRCDTCGKSFTRQDDLVTHIRVHTGEKPYKCQECGKNFSQRGSLLTHQKMHAKHRDLAEKNKIAPGMVSCYASYPLARNYKRT